MIILSMACASRSRAPSESCPWTVVTSIRASTIAKQKAHTDHGEIFLARNQEVPQTLMRYVFAGSQLQLGQRADVPDDGLTFGLAQQLPEWRHHGIGAKWAYGTLEVALDYIWLQDRQVRRPGFRSLRVEYIVLIAISTVSRTVCQPL